MRWSRYKSAGPVLSASEVGQFAFCRQAWYLARRGARVDARGQERLLTGIAAHRKIGRRTDQLIATERMRSNVSIAIALTVGVVLLMLVVRVWVGGA